MRTTSRNGHVSDANSQRCAKLKALIRRWHEGLTDGRLSLLAAGRRRIADADRRSRHASECAAGGPPTPVAGDGPEPIAAGLLTSGGESEKRDTAPSRQERSQALAMLCERLLNEIDGEEVRAAEIRFVVHKHDHPSHWRLDPESAEGVSDGELVWQLRRLIAWSEGAIADVARALETRGTDLDEAARELLRDELAALDLAVETLNVHLTDPIDWDSEFGCLLAGEVAPFEDPPGDENDETDESG